MKSTPDYSCHESLPLYRMPRASVLSLDRYVFPTEPFALLHSEFTVMKQLLDTYNIDSFVNDDEAVFSMSTAFFFFCSTMRRIRHRRINRFKVIDSDQKALTKIIKQIRH